MKVATIQRISDQNSGRKKAIALSVAGVLRSQALALWRQVLHFTERKPKGLRLCESLPLGDRRFVAVVEYEKSRFLLGGTASSLVLLARLENSAFREASPEFVSHVASQPEEEHP